MRAAILLGPRKLIIDDVPVPKPGDHEILVKIYACGICPTDIRYYNGLKLYFPYGEESYGLFGHEWVGEVVEIGRNVDNASVGDRVVVDFQPPCGRCKPCKMGFTNLCMNKKFYARGFAEYALAYSPYAYKLSNNISFEEACFTEPLACCIHANQKIKPQKGENVVIIGAGPMGLLHTIVSRLSGARITVIDLIEDRLRVATELGANFVINSSVENPVDKVMSITDGEGADVVIVTAGSKKAIELSYNLISVGGRIVIFAGLYPPTTIEFDPNILHYKEALVMGSHAYRPIEFQRALYVLESGYVNVKKIVSHVLPLEKLEEGFNISERTLGLKVIIKP